MSESFDAEVVVRRTRYASDTTGWAVIDAHDADGDPVVLVGPLIHLEERERAHVVGTWVDDSRYGVQVKVTEARPLPPTDTETLVAYLRRVKHVGAKRALALVDRYGPASVLEAIDRDPEAAFAAVGLRHLRADQAAASWADLRVMRQLHLLLAPHGLGYLVARISDHYGPTAHRVVIEHPYELTSVFGVGFLIADRIARGTGGPIDERERIRAGALHTLAEAERSGSTCMPIDALLTALKELLAEPVPQATIDEMTDAGYLIREERWIYRPHTAELEQELADRVTAMFTGDPSSRIREPHERQLSDTELTDEQLEGVHGAFLHRLSLITGGPGTGKTASIRTISSLAAEQGIRILLVAPTGRAAIRMGEASGTRATTIHSALGWIPGGDGPAHDEHDPLTCDLLIVDESSMANLELLVTLLRAVAEHTNVVLVGDADQLAPVGAGKPFAELIASGAVPVTRLTHIFRQAAGSMIVQGAHAIRRGAPPSF
jgi:exodeoxyribonuclease V alpha subunit